MRTGKILTTAAVTGLLHLWPMAGSALAHVEVEAPDAAQGAPAALTFHVPTEKDIPTTRSRSHCPWIRQLPG